MLKPTKMLMVILIVMMMMHIVVNGDTFQKLATTNYRHDIQLKHNVSTIILMTDKYNATMQASLFIYIQDLPILKTVQAKIPYDDFGLQCNYYSIEKTINYTRFESIHFYFTYNWTKNAITLNGLLISLDGVRKIIELTEITYWHLGASNTKFCFT